MGRKHFTDEQIAFALRQHDGGTAVAEIIRKQNHRRLVGQRVTSHNGTIVLVERSNSAMVTRESAASVAA